jgi:hypothetical protein
MQNQGIKIGVFLVCFSLALNVLGGLGLGAQIGVDTSAQLDGESVTNADDIQNAGSVSGIGAVVGLATSAINTVATLGGAIDGVQQALVILDVRPIIAQNVQNAANLAFAIGLAAIIRGMRF